MEYPTYHRTAKAPRKPILGTLGRLTLLAYFGITCFALGQWVTIFSDGILFEISGFVSYWVDFGGAE
tara:strand:- start:217 stop:417 length:201 start_codon:yes stop_codon:yes gene_type:complete